MTKTNETTTKKAIADNEEACRACGKFVSRWVLNGYGRCGKCQRAVEERAMARIAKEQAPISIASGDRIEILQGLDEKARVVVSGGGFLADGDTVRVVPGAPATPAAAAAAVKSTASK